jgi:hypothetical protein
LERYNDALVEIGALRADVEKWQAEYAKTTAELEEAHRVLDLQHSKLEKLATKS